MICIDMVTGTKPIDSIEHGTMMDDESAKVMAQKGTWLIPTLVCFQRTDLNAANAMPAEAVRKSKELLAYQETAFRLAFKYGIPIVFGDDDYADGAHEEFGALVKAGLSPIEAIRSATINAAQMLGLEAGVIETGRYADLVAVKGDPTKYITALYDVRFVMKEGKVEKTTY